MNQWKKFLVVVDDEVAFAWHPSATGELYELVIAALSSDPKIVEVPFDHEHFDLVKGGWKYLNGEIVAPEQEEKD